MDPLDSVSPTMQVLRRRMSTNLQRLQAEGRLPIGAAGRARTPSAPERTRRSLKQRLQALDPDDARYAERATDVFVESVLLDEFGQGLTNDASFRQLILEVSRELRDDTEVREQLRELFVQARGR
jgi:hypothetical protein